MSFINHEMWPVLRPFFKVEIYTRDGGAGNPRVRIELKKLPEPLVFVALKVKTDCVTCGKQIHPIRQRRPPGNKRSDVVGTHMYFAAACPLSENIGCSRGTAARDEYLRMRSEIQIHNGRGH